MPRMRSVHLEYIFIVIIAAIMCSQLLFGRIVGLADNGDFCRLMQPAGLHWTRYFNTNVNRLFIEKKYTWDHSFHPHGYLSSELLFIGPAVLVSAVLSKGGLFDIRVLGLLHIVGWLFVLLVLSRFTKSLPKIPRVILWLLLTLIVTDVGYTAYFNSLYSEPSSIIFLPAMVAFGLAAIAHGESDRRGKMLLTGYFVASILFVTAKVQNVFLSLPLAMLGYRLHLAIGSPIKKQNWRIRRYAVTLTSVLLAVSIGYYGIYSVCSDKIKPMNLYNAVFIEILAHSPTPEQDAVELGLDRSMAAFAGISSADKNVIPADTESKVAAATSYGKILKFYARHPKRVIDVTSRVAGFSFTHRPGHLGNFVVDDNLINNAELALLDPLCLPSEYQSQMFGWWSKIVDYLPKTLWFVGLWVILNIVAALVKRFRLDNNKSNRAVSEIHIAVIFIAIMQFATVSLGEGIHDAAKHLFLFNLASDICFIFMIMYVVGGISALRRKQKLVVEIE